MKTIVFSARDYDEEYLTQANHGIHELAYQQAQLNNKTVALAADFPAACCFVDDTLDSVVLKQLKAGGTKLIALRSTGFNNVDLQSADKLGITVMRVARYSPYAVAEFATGLMLCLNRKINRAYNRVKEGNFLLDGLLGFDLHGKVVGIAGTGKVGSVMTQIMSGFGCSLLGYDLVPNPDCLAAGMKYVSLNELFSQADVISLHMPLTPETRHIVNAERLALMKPDALLINTSRGAVVDTHALISAIKKKQLGGVALDVYEEESHIYFRDLSDEIITDDMIERLITFPNVLVTGHQAFFTREAMAMIADTTIKNISDFAAGRANDNILKSGEVIKTS
jgi:D-lactate dehydrogenase